MRYIILSLIFTLTSYSQNEDIRLNGTVGAEGNQIKNVGDPTDAQDVVTKSYLNAIIANLQSQIDDLTTSGEQLYADGTDIDQDDNTFEWINYGTQDWAIENAEVVRYRDGTIIPQVADATEWISLTTGAWCYYSNDPSKGKLYNWYAVAGIHDNDESTPNKEFAPQGWHVPSDAEWTTLEEHLVANGYNYDGSSTGYKTGKSMASTTGWNSSTFLGAVGNDQSLNNSSGFNALPDGYLGHGGDASFYNEGYVAIFWSSTEYLTTPYARYLDRNNNYLYRNYSTKVDGFSVRFVRDASTASVTDQDGNTYDYLTYGDQVWTVENANMVTYRDGTPIPQKTYGLGTEWESLNTGAWCYINNDPTKERLYNWYAVMGIHDTDPNTPNKEFAPEGWHVPVNEEWQILENHLINNGYNYDGTTEENKIAKAMASTTGWNSSGNGGVPGNNQSTNNSSGFNALPVGGLGNLGLSNPEGAISVFWCSDVYNRYLGFQQNFLMTGINPSWEGFSVRFVKD